MKVGAGGHLCFDQIKYLAAGFCLVAGVGLCLSRAEAANVTIVVKSSERLEFDDNISRSIDSAGNVYSSLSTVSTDFNWRTPRLELSASSSTSFRKSAGPGKTDNLNSFDPNLSLGLVKRGLTSQFSLSTSIRVQNTTFSELEDTDITDQDADRLTFSLNSGWTYNINSRNTFTLSGGLTVVDFTTSSAALSPFINLSTQAQWVHNLTRLTSVNGTLGWSLFKSDNVQNTQTSTFSASGGLSTQLSPRLSFDAGGGVNLTTTEQDQIVLGVNLGRTSITTLGLQANLAMNYVLRSTQFSLSLQQGLEPSAEGRLNQRTSLGFNANRRINQHTTVALSSRISRRVAQDDSSSNVTNQFSIDPILTYQLARDWNASIGYNFTYRDSDDGSAQSNKVFVNLSRNMTIDP